MHQQFRNKAQKEVLVQPHGETEVGPVVAEFHALESIALKIYLAIEVLLMEDLHGNLALAAVGGTIMVTMEIQIVFDGTASVLGLFILAGRNRRGDGPEDHQNGDCGENSEENGGIEATADLTGQVPGDHEEEGKQ